MDKMGAKGSAANAPLIGLQNRQAEWRGINTQADPESTIHRFFSIGSALLPPFSSPDPQTGLVLHHHGSIPLGMQFFDPEFGPGPEGMLTGTTWEDVTPLELGGDESGRSGFTQADW